MRTNKNATNVYLIGTCFVSHRFAFPGSTLLENIFILTFDLLKFWLLFFFFFVSKISLKKLLFMACWFSCDSQYTFTLLNDCPSKRSLMMISNVCHRSSMTLRIDREREKEKTGNWIKTWLNQSSLALVSSTKLTVICLLYKILNHVFLAFSRWATLACRRWLRWSLLEMRHNIAHSWHRFLDDIVVGIVCTHTAAYCEVMSLIEAFRRGQARRS